MDTSDVYALVCRCATHIHGSDQDYWTARMCRSGGLSLTLQSRATVMLPMEHPCIPMYMYRAEGPIFDPGFLNPGLWTGLVRTRRCVPDPIVASAGALALCPSGLSPEGSGSAALPSALPDPGGPVIAGERPDGRSRNK